MVKNKSKILKIIAIILLVYAIFFCVVVFLFHHIRNNATDNVAMGFLWNSDDLKEEIGEIRHISRRVKKNEKTQDGRVVPYSVETENARYEVWVTLVESDGQLIATSYEIRLRLRGEL